MDTRQLIALAAIIGALAGCPVAGAATPRDVLTIGAPLTTRTVQPGFLGLSMEYKTLSAYEGVGRGGNNVAMAQLIKNLSPADRPVLRIGGDSTDWSWWPVAGITRPHGINTDLGPTWLTEARALTQTTRARVILGINLEANSTRIAAAEARWLVAGLGSRNIAALEIGNEPELYPILPWYHTSAGQKAFGRPTTYNLGAYTQEFSTMAAILPKVPLAGPSMFGRKWDKRLGQFLAGAQRLRLVTFHAYALDRYGYAFRGRNCQTTPNNPTNPTVARLLDPSSSLIVMSELTPFVALAHSDHLPVRIDEMNAITCAGTPGISDTFASGLWALGALFAADRAGADGVNFHTWRGSAGKLFGFTRVGGDWAASVRPVYYGLLMFSQAAPTGSQLLSTTQTAPGLVQSWATIAPDRKVRIVLINDSLHQARTVQITAPRRAGKAELERLAAPSASSTTGVTLGGQSFGSLTTTGILPPALAIPRVSPRSGRYTISLPAASAAMLTIP